MYNINEDNFNCTAEYINGRKGECVENINLHGLQCVTILIGVFNKENGLPVMGVVNRPFIEKSNIT
ncbi:hypothetical protein NQ314_018528 [Rhamnusium bicolor]|uniref:Uncharacterized protein n=1 Tax=Rhamnusium bicolor TaxID=1586634 RepID=A0AAV8WQS2_9CUCU|nr:hypothetical protein NQ314_018528 [Rhamnusium bicolor]